MKTPSAHGAARATTGLPPGQAVTGARLIRWGSTASMLAGALTISANLLHPPRSLARLVSDAQHTSWELVHSLAILAFIVTAFAMIALYAVQFTRVGLAGLVGFAASLAGIILSLGLLVPDALIFPVLARDPGAVRLLTVPGPIIGNSVFTIYIVVTGVIYCLGTLLFFVVSAWSGSLSRWGCLLVALGMVPLAFGALVWQGLDIVGAIAVGAGFLWIGYSLRRSVDHPKLVLTR